ncbi:endogenous retrovirus group K, member 6 [Gossypium australe]|uniref:Endogenous retrovirus group K, member 6 n=1 Tax=Gossypium australe TaxID=47621 RepID=A0A5B6X3I2_9ROSI|nr:endogenous retrovirus group K, member 6 [Gossypium australe]
MEEFYNNKKQRERKAHEFNKRSFSKSFSVPPSKKTKEEIIRDTSASRFPSRSKSIQHDSKNSVKPANSVESVRNTPKLICNHCRKLHTSECRTKLGSCYRCGSTDHFVRNCPRLAGDNCEQGDKKMSTPQKGRRLANRSGIKDMVCRSEVRAPAQKYVFRAKEEATASDVIVGIFYLFDVNTYALIDPGSNY